MTKKDVDLTDPNCEPTDEDWAEVTKAAGEKVRAQTERMAKDREKRAKASDQTDSSK